MIRHRLIRTLYFWKLAMSVLYELLMSFFNVAVNHCVSNAV